jgi:hypothetical protein
LRAGPAALLCGALLLGGCGTTDGDAPISAEGPDCLAPEVLHGLGLSAEDGDGNEAPARGAVPSGFEPVRALECADPSSAQVAALTDEQYVGRMPAYTPEQLELLGDDAATEATAVAIEHVGDLGPLLEELHRLARLDVATCTPAAPRREVWLVDADGRAIRPTWPAAPCTGGTARADVLLDGLPTSGAIELYAPP